MRESCSMSRGLRDRVSARLGLPIRPGSARVLAVSRRGFPFLRTGPGSESPPGRVQSGPHHERARPLISPGTVNDDIKRVLLTEDRIRAGIASLAKRITGAYAERELVVVSVLKGSCIFASDLVRALPIPLEMEFACVESYRDGTDSEDLSLRLLPRARDIRGRSVLLVDDILDSGRTLRAVRSELLEMQARDVATCVLLDKPSRRVVPIEADYSCFQVEDVFVVGYGLDLAGRYRNLPYIGELRECAIASATGGRDE
ncbi:MAG TPA: hypoxanthine phosphoribosyltransferase [Planctomycetes bacterium]|nr:hypoxanthine phosphoribosyltransferase [Planctomycetota bacterium]